MICNFSIETGNPNLFRSVGENIIKSHNNWVRNDIDDGKDILTVMGFDYFMYYKRIDKYDPPVKDFQQIAEKEYILNFLGDSSMYPIDKKRNTGTVMVPFSTIAILHICHPGDSILKRSVVDKGINLCIKDMHDKDFTNKIEYEMGTNEATRLDYYLKGKKIGGIDYFEKNGRCDVTAVIQNHMNDEIKNQIFDKMNKWSDRNFKKSTGFFDGIGGAEIDVMHLMECLQYAVNEAYGIDH